MRRALLAAAALLGLVAADARAADEAAVLRQRAEALAAQDRCDEALPRARRARALDPDDARAALVEGRCALRQGEYGDAIEPLETARRLDPSLRGVATDLGQVRYHLDELDRADAELDRALERDPDDARALLYRGLVLLRRADDAEAARTLDRASRLDPAVSPTASYYAGLAWEYADDRDRAVESLERARAADPDGAWGREAGRALERVGAEYHRHWWAQVRGGFEHDTNVALDNSNFASRPNPLIPFIGGARKDQRGVYDGELGVELLRAPEWSGGVIGGFQGSTQIVLHEFDMQYPWLAFWLDHRLDEKTWLRLGPYAGYELLGSDPFLVHGGAQLSVDRRIADDVTARVFGRYDYNDFLYRIPNDLLLVSISPPFSELAKRHRDRDGSEVDAGVELELDVDATDTKLRGGAAYERYQSDGADWRHDGVRGWLGVDQPLPADFDLSASASFAHRPYDHVSSFTDYYLLAIRRGRGPKRLDNVWDVEAKLERPITEHVKLAARYAYTHSVSNTRVFDYDRHVVGGYVVLTWGD